MKEAEPPASVAERREPGRVLVIDDQADVRRVIGRALARTGVAVVEVDNGHAALELLGDPASSFDLVLLDLSMPGLDGLQTLERLRGFEPDLPVVLMSGYCGASDAPRSTDGTPNCQFLAKPFSLAELRSVVEAVLATHLTRDEALTEAR